MPASHAGHGPRRAAMPPDAGVAVAASSSSQPAAVLPCCLATYLGPIVLEANMQTHSRNGTEEVTLPHSGLTVEP